MSITTTPVVKPMNEQERQLHYPLGESLPPLGSTLAVAPGVRWIRMGLPFALDHINLWLLRDALPSPDGQSLVQGWTVVDCCITRDETKAQWEQIFANELQGLPIVRVLVTHMHPDHMGLAHWLCERWKAPLWISATDYQAAKLASQSTTGFGGEAAAVFFASHGLTDPDAQAKIKARTSYYPSMVPTIPPRYTRLLDGQTVTIGGHAWRCISGYGHAPEHMALHCSAQNVLISGDMVLPRISTNISVYEHEPEANSLALFLDSIDKFKPLPPDTLVLPSHGRPFKGLHTRVQQLHDHHRDRLADVLSACQSQPQTAAQMLPVLFKRELDLHQTTFAMGESVAHLHHLWFDGKLRRVLGGDGVYRFGVQ
jgi:glyoxylase-like metal-dependent hydrolase (beta-lactamase superfamily II)